MRASCPPPPPGPTLQATARVAAGQVVVVTAAAGGTGHLAVQLAKLAGAQVVAVVGDGRKAQMAADLGADCVVNYREEPVRRLQG